MATSSTTRDTRPWAPKKGRPRLERSEAATEVARRVGRGLFADELLSSGQRIVAEGGTAVDDVDRCYREALPELDRILGLRDVPERDRNALDEAISLYRDRRPRGRLPLDRPTQLLADVRTRVADLVGHIATSEERHHPDHPAGEACVLSVRRAPREGPASAETLRMYLIDPHGDDRRAALDAMRRILWRAAERLRERDLLTVHR